MGKQVNALKTSNLPHAFGRETKEGFNLNPSLSQQFLFDHEQALGKQLTSRRPTQPRFHMGTSNRAYPIFSEQRSFLLLVVHSHQLLEISRRQVESFSCT